MAIYGQCRSKSSYPRRVHVSELSTAEFIDKHLIENEPIIITGCTDNWQAQRWLNEDGSPNYDFLLEQFGHLEVPVTCCRKRKTKKMLFSDFIQLYFEDPQTDLYVRDWHFMSDSNVQWYEVLKYFQSDWINNDALEHPDIFGGDYRFCYMGGSGTFTSFHSDVLNSYSWSSNICGKKIWYMLPEHAELKLSTDPDNITDLPADPLFFEAGGFIFEQFPTDIVFVPTGWFHQVHNSGFTISINHNWVNSFNFDKVISLLFERMDCCIKEVKLLRDDIDNHYEKVEEFLRLDYGMNLSSAIDLCNLILKNRNSHIEIDRSFIEERCTCLLNSNVCESCRNVIDSNDLLICKKAIQVLREKKCYLKSLEWLDVK
ncbi:JmjC domain-containing protein 4 [Aphelenchoides bicaudatus]|nr:JmjC domain-containing protein 4 [Aphelenchoides bicaudatus]